MAKNFDSKILVIDVESTCWNINDQPSNQISEIIEIGIAVVDTKTLEICDNTSILVKPQNSKISKFCTKLTTLTQEQVDKGDTFQTACAKLMKEYHSNNRTFVSWGDYDRKMFERNCKYYNIQYPFGPRHLNLKNSFTLLHGLDQELAMDIALEHSKLELEGTHHRGNWDALNIAKIFIEVLKKFRHSFT